jgi:hypothetical protein
MTTRIRLVTLAPAFALVIAGVPRQASPQQGSFLGRWNLTGTGAHSAYVGWLEITQDKGALTGKFLNRGGHPLDLASVRIENGELIFQSAPGKSGPGPEHRARLQGDRIAGSLRWRDQAVEFVGTRPPKWPPSDANAAHTFGAAVELFDGKSMAGFDVQLKDRPAGWEVSEGLMKNPVPGNNLISKQKFQDFRLHAEYKLEKDSHSGIYLRGRYELQVLDHDYGQPPDRFSHMAVYGWVAPLVNGSNPEGEWQIVDATIVGNKLSVVLNGKKVHDNTTLEAITGNALDANETEPGPIMLLGNHGKVAYRRVIVTPIVGKAR